MIEWFNANLEAIVIIAAVLGLVVVFAFAFVSRRLGNAGGGEPCIKCGLPGTKWIPRTADRGMVESLLDFLFRRRLDGRPPALRIDHLMDDRRLCVTCYRGEIGDIESDHAETRNRIVRSNDTIVRELYARENARRGSWLVVKPESEPLPEPRSQTDSKPTLMLARKAEP